MKKQLLILALAVFTIALISPLAAAADYPGGSGHWAEGSIARCDDLGILTGLLKPLFTEACAFQENAPVSGTDIANYVMRSVL